MSALPSIAVLLCWFYLQRPALHWLIGLWGREDLRLHLVLGMAALVTASAYLRQDGIVGRLKRPMQARPLPLAVLAGSLALQLALHRLADVDLLDVGLFGVGSWALLGLILESTFWWRLLPVALLGLCLLPLEGAVDAYLGYPARRLTAMWVTEMMRGMGLQAMDSATVLRLDTPGGAIHTQVDVPCAGVRSLWSGELFLLGLAVLRGRGIDRRIVLVTPILGALLIGTNTARVAVLVGVQAVLQQPYLARMIHVPLGILGFLLSLGITGLLVMADRPTPLPVPPSPPVSRRNSRLTSTFLCVLLLFIERTDIPAAEHLAPVNFHFVAPTGWHLAPAPLSSIESAFFSDLDGGEPPQKSRFSVGPLGGSLILVPARSWRAHHLPENCLAPLGVEGVHTILLREDLPARTATAGQGSYTLLWWFEAEDRRTNDLFTRAWADLSGQQDRWVMVSLLLDGTPSFSNLSTYIPALAASVRAGLES